MAMMANLAMVAIMDWSWHSVQTGYAAAMTLDITPLPALIRNLDPQLNDRLSPLVERGKVALYLALRARLGHEIVGLHTSHLVDAKGQDMAPARYVVRVADRFLTEHGTGDWGQYPVQALKRARQTWKRKGMKVLTGPAIGLSQIVPEETDTRVVRCIQSEMSRLGQ